MAKTSKQDWFDNCGSWAPHHDLSKLLKGIASGMLNEQDDEGMSALHRAVASGWQEGVEELIRAGADTESRHYRTGTTALYTAVQEKNKSIVEALIAAGANPDAANYWAVTPRRWNLELFRDIPPRQVEMPEPRIQNAEDLADHYHPRFKIPSREERESLKPGQAVSLYVYGPKSETKKDTIKVRIAKRIGEPPLVRYVAVVETPLDQTHLADGTTEVDFGPENVATVFVPRANKTKKRANGKPG